MPLKNRQQSIPGGFDWNQPETGFTFRSDVFVTTRNAIIDDRNRNPRHKLRTDPEYVEFEMEQRYVAKLKAMPGGDQWLVPEGVEASPPVFQRPRSRAHAAVGEIGSAKAGIGMLVYLFGPALKAVAPELSERRAGICVTCPQNQEGGLLAHVGGEALKSLLQAKSDMKLSTTHDEQLKECTGCNCNLRLKVHVRLDYILERTSPEVMARLDKRCWIPNRDA